MFSYNIAKNASRASFEEVCTRIEAQYPNIEKEPIIEDVDGTQIQIYYLQRQKVKVINDYEVDAVYIDSDIELKI